MHLRLMFIAFNPYIMIHLCITMLTPQSSDWLIYVKMISCVAFVKIMIAQARLLMNSEKIHADT